MKHFQISLYPISYYSWQPSVHMFDLVHAHVSTDSFILSFFFWDIPGDVLAASKLGPAWRICVILCCP